MSELKKVYLENVVPALMKKLGYKNIHEVPKIEKIVINSSFGAEMDKTGIADLRNDIASLSGQAPVIVKAKISVSNFKLRQGMPVGVKVTLRGNQMWEFLYRLVAISLPNIRDFRGVRAKLDGRGNYSLGVTDHSIFPEINVERQRVNVGLDICITTTANNDEEGKELLQLLGMPFRKQSSQPVEQAA
ncbi:MAG: 50S ribosomal protein L5 [Opitutae bacterium]|jgi:large subunit ribosomal protein L5|nr:50S ribosomal protein L5 [Verrucomicrobiota bacterium]MDA0906148.1 50S ribosomal protein L5 [Verrucomicrobiota bacterium]NDG99495.1 50S ribosomal protein L5 [Opitutae bacterium]NDH15626.1 50S ribosomal protein L5 [Opitutae bacterium]